MKIHHNVHGWIDGTPAEGDEYLEAHGGKFENGVLTGYGSHPAIYSTTPATPDAIRKISTGAMQRRFTITEEVFIASDPAATVIKSRLLNASYADLDFQDTIDGVTYICSVLKVGEIITDEAAHVIKLLRDGTQDESI